MKDFKINKNIRKFIDVDDVLAIAVSGGIDSMVLLHAVNNLGILNKSQFFVVNIEHGIRGEESLADSKFVKDYCKKFDIRFCGFSVDALTYSKEHCVTVEEGARALRYNIFQKLLEEGKCNKVALAHHQSDLAETVLMRIIRGTGISGLVGMKEVNGGYIRPLLNVTKSEIKEYQSEYNIPFVTDKTNFDNAYTRNLLRNEIIPAMNKISLDAEAGLTRLSRLAAENEDFLLQCDNPIEVGDGFASIKIIKNEHTLLFKRRVRKCFVALGVHQDIEERHVEIILALLSKPNGTTLDMPFGVKAYKEYDKITFTRLPQNKDFNVPYHTGKTYFCNNIIKIEPYIGEDIIKGELIFDNSKIPSSAVIRTRCEKDKFTKFGGGTKSLGDFLTDKKIPLRIRDTLAICADGNDVLFIVGLEISDKIKIDRNTKKTDIYIITSED